MGSSSPGPTPTSIRNFESLIPQCFYSYVFLFARLFLIIALSVIAGIVGSLLNNMTKAGEPAATSVVAIMIVTSASLLWCLSSWSGYSRRHFPYKVTIVTDVLFLIPFGVFSVLLGLPMHDGGTKCPQVNPQKAFTIRTGPLGVIDFSGERTGRVACTKLYLLWVLMLVVCACFVLSAGSIGVIHSQATKISKALWSARAAMIDPMGGSDYHRSPSDITVARLREAFHGFERQLREELGVHVSTRSLDSGEAAADDDHHDDDHVDRRGGGGVYYQNKDPYRVNTTNRSGAPPRTSRYDCNPRVDSSVGYRDEYGASSSSSSQGGRSLGNAVLQPQAEGNGLVINNYNNRS